MDDSSQSPAERALERARAANVRVWLEGERLRCVAPPGADAAAIVQSLAAERTGVIALLRRERLAPLEPGQVRSRWPLSLAEARLWFLDQLTPNLATYNLPCPVRLVGPLDVEALGHALGRLVARHESLRTRFEGAAGEPRRIVDPPPTTAYPLQVRSLEALEPAARAAEVARAVHDGAQRPFDLRTGPLLRASLLRLSADEHVLLLETHHIVSDDASLRIMLEELGELYRDREAVLPRLPLVYADFAAWQERVTTTRAAERRLRAWADRIATYPTLDLPTDHPRRLEQRHPAATLRRTLPASLAADVRTLARRERVTVFVVVMAAFAILLGRWSGAKRFLVGVPSAGRGQEELEPLVGLFVQTLVVPIDLDGDPTGRQLLARIRQATLEAQEHDDVPFEKIAQRINPARDLTRSPIFQVMLTLLDEPGLGGEAFARAGLGVSGLPVALDMAKFDLALDVTSGQHGDGTSLGVTLEYRTDLFEPGTAERIADHFALVLQGLTRTPGAPVFALQMLTDEERARCLRASGASGAPWRPTEDGPRIHELVRETARRRPDAAAVTVAGSGVSLSYRELLADARRIAGRIVKGRKRGGELIVALCLERSPALIAALVGVLEAGGAYLPLDPTYPVERLRGMIEDSRPAVVLADTRTAAVARSILRGLDTELVLIDGEAEVEVDDSPPAPGSSSDRAYVIYTSGSTGRPKGVEVEHRSLVHFARAMIEGWAVTEEDRVLQFTTINWDTSAEEIWPCLVAGATLVLRTEAMLDPHALLDACDRDGLTVLDFSTAYFPELVRAIRQRRRVPGSLRLVQFGGDRASPETVLAWYEATRAFGGEQVRLVHGYGVTEGTAMTTTCDLAHQERALLEGAVPIGTPLAGMSAYVVDDRLALVAPGIVGELCIGGAGVARGYLGDPALTERRFVPDTVLGCPGARMYRTGDRARLREDGALEVLGRIDQQIKVRGIRVEIGDIEEALRRHPGVRDACVVVRAERIVAFCEIEALAERSTPADLGSWAAGQLPEYMVPRRIVLVDTLPMLPSGKVARDALIEPSPVSPVEGSGVAPRDEEERTLAAIWCELLETPAIGIHDNFFELGGHSLLVLRVLAHVRERLGVELGVRDLFEAPTIAGLRARLDRTTTEPLPPIAARVHDVVRLSESQRGLWSACRPGTSVWKNGFVTRIRGPLDGEALARAVRVLQERHELLRAAYERAASGALVLRIAPPSPLGTVDLAAITPPEARESALQELLRASEVRPVSYAPGEPASRFDLYRLADDEHVVALTSHNLIVGGSSVHRAEAELFALVEAIAGGDPLPPAPTLQYADYVDWRERFVTTEPYRRRRDHWARTLAGAEPLRLPYDSRDRDDLSVVGVPHAVVTPHALERFARTLAVTKVAVVLALYAVFLHQVTEGQRDLCILQLFESRPRLPGIERLIGHFLVQLPIRLRIGEDETFGSLARQAMARLTEAYANADVAAPSIFGTEDVYNHPLVTAILNFGGPESLVGSTKSGLRLEPVEVLGVRETRRMPLAWVVTDAGAETPSVDGVLVGAASHFRRETTERIGRSLARLAAVAFGGSEDVRVSQLCSEEAGRLCVGAVNEELRSRGVREEGEST